MPYITKLAPGQDSLAAMRTLYIKTEQKIINEITRKRALGLVDYADVAALDRVRAILKNMTDTAEERIPQAIERFFYKENDMPGAAAGYANAQALTSTQTETVATLVNNLLADIDEAAAMAYESAAKYLAVGRLEAGELRNLTLTAVAEKEAAGKGWNTIQRQMAAELNAKGLTSFIDKRGHEWSLASYCSMATRTTGRQAQVAAALTANEDQDLWQISKIGSTCPLCSVYEGRVYSRSGLDPNYPPLAMAFGKIDPAGSNDISNTWLNIHPQCLHTLVPYTTIGKSDKEIEHDRKYSSFTERPANIDYRTRKQRDAYRTKERNRAQYRTDVKQFDKYRAALGDDFPKTFETFRKHKLAGDDEYKEWERKYREVNAKGKELERELAEDPFL